MRWMVVIVWLLVVVSSILVLPDLGAIVKETESKFLAQDAESVVAKDLINKINQDDKSRSNGVIVLHREGGLQEADKKWLDSKLQELKLDKDALGIMSFSSAFDEPALA